MLLLFSGLIVLLFSAPSRPPKIISTKMNYSGKMINIAWEQVEPLANESAVEGYKVRKTHSGCIYSKRGLRVALDASFTCCSVSLNVFWCVRPSGFMELKFSMHINSSLNMHWSMNIWNMWFWVGFLSLCLPLLLRVWNPSHWWAKWGLISAAADSQQWETIKTLQTYEWLVSQWECVFEETQQVKR